MRSAHSARLSIPAALVVGVWVLGAVFAVSTVLADGSLYESQRVDAALSARGLAIDPAPGSKRIAFIVVAREDVFLEGELMLPLVLPKSATTWPNHFRFLTAEDVIRRELLLEVGDAYEASRIEETMRNLRALGIFALVRIVPVQTREPDAVGLLIYTRDMWSLRLETSLDGAGEAFTLAAALTERNFLGRDKTLAIRSLLDPKTFSFGEAYVDPRLLGSELTLDQSFDVIFNREHQEPEGSRGSLELSLPFRNLQQTWGWTVSGKFDDSVYRALRGTEIRLAGPGPNGDAEPCAEIGPECMRVVWDDESYSASVAVGYRRGVAYKQTFSLALAFSGRAVAPNAETGLAPGQEQLFRDTLLPRTRRQIYPALTYELWLPTYAVFENLSTFGKIESVRVGPSAEASVRFPLEAFGSSTDSVVFEGALGYVYGDGRTIAELAFTAGARVEEGLVADQVATAVLRGATPPFLLGRLVLRLDWAGRMNDTERTLVVLGGSNGLRGYPSAQFGVFGGNRARANLEYRSLPIVIESVHIGAVAFYDAGTLYPYRCPESEDPRVRCDEPPWHSLGVGLRVLFPQLNYTPFRIDVGFPLEGGFALEFSYGGEQGVPLTAADDLALTRTF